MNDVIARSFFLVLTPVCENDLVCSNTRRRLKFHIYVIIYHKTVPTFFIPVVRTFVRIMAQSGRIVDNHDGCAVKIYFAWLRLDRERRGRGNVLSVCVRSIRELEHPRGQRR